MRFAMLLFVAGCRSIFGIHDPSAAADDANTDVAGDGGPIDGGCQSFSSLFDTCALPPGAQLPGSATAYDSDTGILTNGANPMPMPHVTVATTLGSIDVVSITTFVQDADGNLRITGTLPVAFAVTGELEISGRVDLSAGGAGAGCDANGTGENGVIQLSASDGGGGGGNIEIGGDGGGGDLHSTLTHGGIAQGAGLHGGCAGGRGAGGLQGAIGGLGGGAIYLVAASHILITGVIDASGGGGKGALVGNNVRGGGGGGAAGGLLMLEAPTVDVAGQLDATGGGGGGGANNSVAGIAGKLGSAGGNGGHGSTNNTGGHGGNGVANAMQGLEGTTAEGGGGGGGSVGRITITSPGYANAGTVAPPPS